MFQYIKNWAIIHNSPSTLTLEGLEEPGKQILEDREFEL